MKNGLHLFFLFGLLVMSRFADAQQVIVKGVVTDDKFQPVFTGNVVFYTIPDSTYITGEVITEGKFQVAVPIKDSVLLKCSSMGFEPQWYTLVRGVSDTINCDTLHLLNANMKEVEIRAMAPVVQNKGNMLQVDVENSSLSAMGTAYEVLENTPGLTLDMNGNVTVFGRGTAMLYLDGQRIPAEMLRSIPSVTISHVEILKNPPASYDAQGRAVVNVVTKKKAMEGYNVDLFQQVTYTKMVYGYTGISGYWRKNRWTITGRSGMFMGNRWENTLYIRSFDEDSIHYTMRNEINEKRRIPPGGYPGLTFQYRPDSISHIDVSTNFSFFRNYKDVDNTNIISADGTESVITTTREDENRNWDAMYRVGYTRTLDSLGSEIYVSGSFTDYHSTRLGNISQNVATPAQNASSDLRNTSENTIRFGIGQFNWTKYLDSAWKMETGIKYTQIVNGSEVGMQRLSDGEWTNDSAILNSFSYREQTAAGFLQGTFEKEKWFITAGLRAEYSLTDGKSLIYDQKLIDTTYMNIFPMAEITYEIIDDLEMALNYSWSIERPDFEDLDPFIIYIDSLSYMKGNPALKPEYIHDFTAELIYLEAASIGFSYAYTKQGMEMFVERTGVNNSQFVAQTRNFDYVKTIGFDVAIPYQNKWWTTYNTIGYNHSIYHYEEGDDYAHNDANGWFFFVYDKFSLRKYWSMEVMYWYATGQSEGLFMSRPMQSLRASLMFKSLDNNFSVRLMFNDILYTSYVQADSRIPGFDLYYKEAGDSRQIRVAVSYRFGKVKQQQVDERQNNESERSRIKG